MAHSEAQLRLQGRTKTARTQGHEIGLFAHKNGMQITAASGKVDVQAHDDDIALGAAKELHVYSLKSILVEAPEVVIRAEGV